MIKAIFKGLVYFLGLCTLIGLLSAACEDESVDQTKLVETDQGNIMIVPEEPDSEVEFIPAEPEIVEEYNVPLEHEMALKAAQNYVDLMAFSEAGLYNQLTSEYGSQFPEDAAMYAMENVEVDYFAEALESAENYVDLMAFSKEELYEQLTSEYGDQFTPEQAEYAVNQVYGEE